MNIVQEVLIVCKDAAFVSIYGVFCLAWLLQFREQECLYKTF
jgi:hypothetical protein